MAKKQTEKNQTECGKTFSITPAKTRQLSPEEEEECRRLADLSIRASIMTGHLECETECEREATLILTAIRLADASKDKELAAERERVEAQKKQLRGVAENILAAEAPLAASETTTQKTKELSAITKKGNIPARITFGGPQAFFDGKDLGLPTGAEVNPVEILKKLVESFGKVVRYEDLDENSDNTASDFLRGKIATIRLALQKHKVPCKIKSKKWAGYVLNTS